VYTIGLPIKEAIHDLPTQYFVKELPDMKVHRVLLTGPYRHLGTAWATQVMYQRAKKFKSKKGLVPFEVYLNNPQDTEEKELKTAVCFPVI
jgi:DNA gyrase inhibitor GyrI